MTDPNASVGAGDPAGPVKLPAESVGSVPLVVPLTKV
jgi:hypothetical protein